MKLELFVVAAHVVTPPDGTSIPDEVDPSTGVDFLLCGGTLRTRVMVVAAADEEAAVRIAYRDLDAPRGVTLASVVGLATADEVLDAIERLAVEHGVPLPAKMRRAGGAAAAGSGNAAYIAGYIAGEGLDLGGGCVPPDEDGDEDDDDDVGLQPWRLHHGWD